MIEDILRILTENPVYLGIAAVLAAVILFGVIKKLLKLVLVIAAILILYIAYLVWTDQDVPKSLEELGEKVQETVEKGKDKVEQFKDKKTREAVDKILDE